MKIRLKMLFLGSSGEVFCPTLIVGRMAYACKRRGPHRRRHRFEVPGDADWANTYVAGRGTV